MTEQPLKELQLRPYRRNYGVWRDWPGTSRRPPLEVRVECLACSREATAPGRCVYCGGSLVAAEVWSA